MCHCGESNGRDTDPHFYHYYNLRIEESRPRGQESTSTQHTHWSPSLDKTCFDAAKKLSRILRARHQVTVRPVNNNNKMCTSTVLSLSLLCIHNNRSRSHHHNNARLCRFRRSALHSVGKVNVKADYVTLACWQYFASQVKWRKGKGHTQNDLDEFFIAHRQGTFVDAVHWEESTKCQTVERNPVGTSAKFSSFMSWETRTKHG